jgi:hypothetical protein
LRTAILLACAAAIALGSPTGDAVAYEFEVGARTIGQAYQLRFGERGRLLQRRRFTQRLTLDVWGILEPSFDPGRPDPPPLAPFDVFVSVNLRLDHDFGDYTRGDVAVPISPTQQIEVAAVSAVPELAAGDLALVVLEASAGARGLLDRFDVTLGRQIFVDSLDVPMARASTFGVTSPPTAPIWQSNAPTPTATVVFNPNLFAHSGVSVPTFLSLVNVSVNKLSNKGVKIGSSALKKSTGGRPFHSACHKAL